MRSMGHGALIGVLLLGCIEVPERAAVAIEPGDGAVVDDMGRGEPPVDVGPIRPDALGPVRDRGPDVDPLDRGRPPDQRMVDMALPCPGGGTPTEGELALCLRVETCDPLPVPRASHEMVQVVDGQTGAPRILVAGGTRGEPSGVMLEPGTFLYDPAADSWQGAGNFTSDNEGVHRHTLTALPDGRALLVGGSKDPAPGEGNQSESFIFDPRTTWERPRGGWRDDGNFLGRSMHAAAWDAEEGEIHVSGGLRRGEYDDTGDLQESHGWTPPDLEEFDDNGQWSGRERGDPKLFGHHLLALADGTLLRFGGWRVDSQARAAVADGQPLRWDGDDWVPLERSFEHIDGPVVPTPAGILLVGGTPPADPATSAAVGRRLRRVELPEGTPRVLPELRVHRSRPGAARIGEGALVVILGGQAEDPNRLAVEVMDVADGQKGLLMVDLALSGEWTDPRAIRLPDGDAIFVGGRVDGVPTTRCVRVALGE